MNNWPIQQGDIVRRKTGGPAMLVEEVHPPDTTSPYRAKCLWWDGKHTKADVFRADELEVVDTRPGSSQ
jgi:uncharacterized protein YodC (DUF2158 family)